LRRVNSDKFSPLVFSEEPKKRIEIFRPGVIWTLEQDAEAWTAWAEHMAEAVATPLMQDLIAAYKSSQRVWALDIGCGIGRAFLPLVEAGYRVIGIDPTTTCVQLSQQRAKRGQLNAYPILATAAQLPIQAASIDFIFAISCLFHLSLPELTSALQEIQRVLVPGGRVILHFLDLDDWRRSLARQIRPEQAPLPSYRAVVTCFCTQEKVQGWIDRAGLRLEKLELRTNTTDQGQQRNWLASCTK
jgi:SAM-dependent methyltransferase